MGSKTKIDWCDATWNPVTGCLHGCEYCYARKIAERFKGCDYGSTYKPFITEWKRLNPESAKEQAIFETSKDKHVVNVKFDAEKQKYKISIAPYPFGFQPTLHRHKLDEPQKWKKPKNIFVCSMADLFGEWVPEEWIQEVFAACDAAPQHRYIFLTKNPDRISRMYAKRRFEKLKVKLTDAEISPEIVNTTPMPERDNWWFGSSVTNKGGRFAQGSILDHNFISIEPMLEPLDAGIGSFGRCEWIIIGAETGNRRGKVKPQKAWIDNIVQAASITGAKVFMKESLRGIMGHDFRQEFPWE